MIETCLAGVLIWLLGMVVLSPLILGLCRSAALQDELMDKLMDKWRHDHDGE